LTNHESRERAILAAVELTGRAGGESTSVFQAEEPLEELAALAESAGAEIVARVVQQRSSYDHATLIGQGKAQEIGEMVRALEADLVLIDHDLGGTQQRNLEKALDCRVVDRTQLILDIFARRARTREGQLQVELAQLNYLLPRLTGRGIEMSRLGGGIGTRGPGETKLETDRRHIHRRIKKLEADLDAVRGSRSTQRRQRQAVPLPAIALVGYTNAGKSTLFNRLTSAGVLADARMFATLDPTVRQLKLPSRRHVVLSDTVGFIRRLPTTLVKAFRATLEEVKEATLLLHVVDASAPAASEHCTHVRSVLAEIGAEAIPQLIVLNKADRSPAADLESTAQRLSGEAGGAGWAAISALTGEGLDALLDEVDRRLDQDPVDRVTLLIPHAESALIDVIHGAAVIVEREFTEQGCRIVADMPASIRRRLVSYLEEYGQAVENPVEKSKDSVD
jgi:GTP-binding protein HflX